MFKTKSEELNDFVSKLNDMLFRNDKDNQVHILTQLVKDLRQAFRKKRILVYLIRILKKLIP